MIMVNKAVINIRGFPESEAEDIRRCLAALYSVRAGEQPLDRDFGISNDFLDLPANLAKNRFALEVVEKTEKYEKRVKVDKVEYQFDQEGQMVPIISLKRGGE